MVVTSNNNSKCYKCDTLMFDIASHASKDLICVSNIDGEVLLFSVDGDIKKLDTIEHHTDSVRRVIFSSFSDEIMTISSDLSFATFDIETRELVNSYEDAHENAIYSICELREHIVATGDDKGVIKLWDTRKDDPIMIQPEHDNFISSLSVDSTGSTLLAASGDGRLSVWNSRQRKLIARSDECDCELLTCDVVRANTKVICGDGDGVLNIFSWADWGDISDRVPVQSDVSIDVVMCYSDEVVVLGCMDGVIRATTLFPHIPLTHIGDHGNNAIEGLCLTHDASQILSIGHDYKIRAWSTTKLDENVEKVLNGSEGNESEKDSNDDDDDDDSDDSDEDDKPKRKKIKHITADQVKSQEAADFFSDLA